MISRIIDIINARLIYPIIFKGFGYGSKIKDPMKIEGFKRITIGRNTIIGYNSWIASMPLTGSESIIKIGNNCNIGNINHIYSTKSIIIEDNVLTADKVYISDNQHTYDNPDIPIKNQPIKQCKTIIIKEGSWIGENVCIIGASIGKNSVIGANSVVTHDIPDYTIAVGAPARVIKKYNFKTRKWEKVE